MFLQLKSFMPRKLVKSWCKANATSKVKASSMVSVWFTILSISFISLLTLLEVTEVKIIGVSISAGALQSTNKALVIV